MRERLAAQRLGWVLCLAAAAAIAADRPASSNPAGFIEIPADRIPWQPHPAVKSGEFAVLVGKPAEAGPLVVRVKLPPNTEFAAHTHPEARTYTVLAGVWKLGFGEKYDATALRSYAAGSVYRLPANVAHFQATGAEGATVQIESIGPTKTQFIEAPNN
jgi:quercetin dioxygenase-like cupin family protein